MHSKRVVLCILAFALMSAAEPSLAAQRSSHIFWPSREYPALQSAIDALPDGGRLTIAAGTFRVDQGLNVIGKRILIEGAGCADLPNSDRTLGTNLAGPIPRSAVDPANATGLFNFIDAGGYVRGIKLSGFDAGIVTRDRSGGSSKLEVSQTCITEAGYGVLGRSGASLVLDRSIIRRVRGHGAWISPSLLGSHMEYGIYQSIIEDAADGACAVFENTFVVIDNTHIGICTRGGAAFFGSTVFVKNSFANFNGGPGLTLVQSGASFLNNKLSDNRATGMLIVESSAFVKENQINHSTTLGGGYGDGITIVQSTGVTLTQNKITNNVRAAVASFGATVAFESNTMTCNTFDVDVEPWLGQQPTNIDFGGNQCGCGAPLDQCEVVSSSLSPPAPLDP